MIQLLVNEQTKIVIIHFLSSSYGLPWWLSGEESACSAGDQV